MNEIELVRHGGMELCHPCILHIMPNKFIKIGNKIVKHDDSFFLTSADDISVIDDNSYIAFIDVDLINFTLYNENVDYYPHMCDVFIKSNNTIEKYQMSYNGNYYLTNYSINGIDFKTKDYLIDKEINFLYNFKFIYNNKIYTDIEDLP